MFVEFSMFCSSNRIAIFALNSAALNILFDIYGRIFNKKVSWDDWHMTPYHAYTATSLIWLRPVSGHIRDINEVCPL